MTLSLSPKPASSSLYLSEKLINLEVSVCFSLRGLLLLIPPSEIQPFVLYTMKDWEEHLCPIRALAAWLDESKIMQGYIFRKIASGDRVAEANHPMV
jgi:hypothetical protein